MAKAKEPSKWADSPFPAACDYIEKLGIDPTTVRQEGVTDIGYYYINRANNATIWTTWPEGHGQKVIELMSKKKT